MPVPSSPAAAAPDTVLVVDFGAQYAQLIARRVREARVYSEIVPSTMPVAEMLARNPAAIILSGGPSSVYAEDAPQQDAALFEAGVPVLGICYGFQAMAQALGGTVAHTGAREYGATTATAVGGPTASILEGSPGTQTVWMSHGDSVVEAPAGFEVLASTETTPVAAFADDSRRLYGVLDRRLEGREFVADALSVADFAILGWAWRHPRHKVELKDFPNVERWYNALMARPATKRGMEAKLD